VSHHPPAARPRASRSAATAGVLLLAGLVALAVATLLGLWVVDVLGSTRLWRVETVVAPAVVAVGVLAAGWVGTSAVVAGACAAVRTAGGAWRVGEAAVQRWAPGLVRRALAVVVVAGVGLGTAAGAHATVAPVPDPSPPAVTVDLGWTPTVTDGATTRQDDVPTGSPTTTEVPVAEVPVAEVPVAVVPVAVVPLEQVPTTQQPAWPATPGGDAASDAVVPDAVVPGEVVPGEVVPVAAHVPTVTGADAAPPAPVASDVGTIVVQAGDTLWGLAARHLGPDADDAAIAALWPRWYAANVSVIGPDPDVLQPGQVLVVPTATDGSVR